MNRADHTPASWSHDRGDILAADGRCLATVFSGACETLAEAEANGMLMAASPHLLRVARLALDEFSETHVPAQDPAAWRALLVGELKAAIAAATPPP